MTDCNGCGACCDPFMMVYAPVDIEVLGPLLDPDERQFYVEHLTPIRRKDGRRMVAAWSSGISEFLDPQTGVATMLFSHYYRCDRYDPVAKRCTDYEHRPDVCRGFPWYGKGPDPRKTLPPTCSYLADVGREVEVPVDLEAKG